MSSTELAQREERAQQGLVQFAEEMQAISDGNLYPGAKIEPDAWKRYCAERWALGVDKVERMMRSAPVIARLAETADSAVSVEKASVVATLPIAVQDAILTNDPKAVAEDDIKAKAKAARKVIKTAEAEGRGASVEELVAAVANVRSARPKPKQRKRTSKFTGNFALALHYIEAAADVAHSDTLTEVENDYAWKAVAKAKYHLERIQERLSRPEFVKDVDEEFAALLGGSES